jgi:hypothetical protein
MTTKIDGTNGIIFPDSTVQGTAAVSIGIGQTWQTVTRTAGTTYTNTTGRSIVTQCVVLASTVQSYTLTVSGTVVAYYQGQYSPAQIAGTISAIIPPGATYVFTATGSPTVVNQIELR